jgi:predicted nucleic acid-binding protein
MATSGSRQPVLLVDTSVAVPLAVGDHEHHQAVFEALSGHRRGLAGHAAFKTFSVLTRLPPPARRTASTVARLLAATFPNTRFLSAEAAVQVFAELKGNGIAGGAVYDALVGATAVEHGLSLATRDRRALNTYRALDVKIELLY